MKKLEISKIRTDGGTQMRAELDEATVAEYSELFAAGVELEAIEVYFDGMAYWLADGFQRVAAALDAGLDKILANITTGTKRDAILHACGANALHGLKRTNADKRRAVETLLNDEEWVKWSDRKIADAAAVSDPFVASIRAQLLTVSSSQAAKAADQPRVGKDGKERKAPAPKADREPKSVPKHVIDTPDPKAGKPKISGGNTFNVEEFGDKSAVEDEAGNRIPDDMVPVFGQKDAFDDVLSHLSKAKSAIERLLDTPAGGLIKNSLASIDLKNIYTQVKFAKPFAVCPRKSHKNCDTCKGRGWINEDVHKEIVKREGAA
jgi:hypothetical protein